MPGIDSRAPERTETSSGSSSSPRRLAGALLQALERLGDLLGHPVGLGLALVHVATQASVVIVKPAGTRSSPSTRVISATLAPLPPSSSRACPSSPRRSRRPTSSEQLSLLDEHAEAVTRAQAAARDPRSPGVAAQLPERGRVPVARTGALGFRAPCRSTWRSRAGPVSPSWTAWSLGAAPTQRTNGGVSASE